MAVPHSGIPSPALPRPDGDVDDLAAQTLAVAGPSVLGDVTAAAATVASLDATGDITSETVLAAPSIYAKGEPWHDVKAYGAIGDNVADDSAEIQAAATAAGADGTLFIPPGHYLIGTTGLVFSGPVEATGATLHYTGTGTAITVRNGAGATIITHKRLNLPSVVKDSPAALSGRALTLIGIAIWNVDSCAIYVPESRDFGIGVLGTADGTGFAYNTIHLGRLFNNKVNLKIAPNAGGWVNENTWFAGRYHMGSGEGTNITGARHIHIDHSATSNPNNNRFIGSSLEGSGPEFTVECEGSYNEFIGCRWEGTPKVLFDGSSAHSNVIFHGFQSHSIVFTESNGALKNHVYHRGRTQMEGEGTSGVVVGANASSSNNPVFTAIPAGDRLASDAATRWGWRAGHNFMEAKATADTGFRIRIANQTGAISFGDGAGGTIASITSARAAGLLRFVPINRATVFNGAVIAGNQARTLTAAISELPADAVRAEGYMDISSDGAANNGNFLAVFQTQSGTSDFASIARATLPAGLTTTVPFSCGVIQSGGAKLSYQIGRVASTLTYSLFVSGYWTAA